MIVIVIAMCIIVMYRDSSRIITAVIVRVEVRVIIRAIVRVIVIVIVRSWS